MKTNIKSIILIGYFLLAITAYSQAQQIKSEKATSEIKTSKNMKNKILFVVTSHDKKGNTGQPAGYHLGEVSHPWEVLYDAGYEMDIVSPKGGNPPVESFTLNDPTNKKFWENQQYKSKRENSMKPSEVKTDNYVAIFFAGGYGAMWDFPDNSELAKITAKIYEKGGFVSAVCHGPSALVNVKLSNGKYLVDGKRVNSFTSNEERMVNFDKGVPFLLEDKLIERGGVFEQSGFLQPHIAVDQRLITGQNPASAKGVGEALLEELKKLHK